MQGNSKPRFVITDGLPEGWHIDVHDGRRQPFTLWAGNETIYFAETRRKINVAAGAAMKEANL